MAIAGARVADQLRHGHPHGAQRDKVLEPLGNFGGDRFGGYERDARRIHRRGMGQQHPRIPRRIGHPRRAQP